MTGADRAGKDLEGELALSLQCRVVQAAGVLSAPADGELLLVREDTDECYVLRGSGADIWEAARKPVLVGDICTALVRTYSVDSDTCQSNVLRNVEELLRAGLFLRAP